MYNNKGISRHYGSETSIYKLIVYVRNLLKRKTYTIRLSYPI